ncbi:MAG: efflux RND transporter periplasmic adaptor subunit [Thermoanaerobaculia bacterium]
MKQKLVIAAGALVLLAVVLASIFGGRSGSAVEVFVEEAVRRDITQIVKASGQIQPRVKVNISAHVVGKIDRLYVQEGQEIAAGQPFLELEREAFLAARDNARAQLEMGRTEVRQGEVSLADQEVRQARAAKLAEQGISSPEALEAANLALTSARLRLEQARETVKQAEALLSKAEDDLRKTTIYAPLTGRVIALNAEQGEVVVSGTMNNPASVIGTIADVSEILAEIDVDETEIVHLAVGQSAWVRVDAVPDREYRSRVVEIGSSGYAKPSQPDVTFFRVKLLLGEPDEALRPGMSARADIEVATHRDTVVVPIQCVVERDREDETTDEPQDRSSRAARRRPPQQVVFVVSEGKAELRRVKSGISDATEVEILEGVAAGEKVVSGPQRILRRLESGDAVRLSRPDLSGSKKSDEEKK